MRNILTTGILAAFVLTACTKEGPAGPQGPVGPQGSANVGRFELYAPLSGYTHFSATNAWGISAAPVVPQLQSNQLAMVYVSLTPAVAGHDEWVQQPFNFYFNGTNNFNEYFHSVDNGDLWLYIRNSGGGQPYTTMTGNLYYKVFVIQSSMLQEMEAEHVDARLLPEFLRFLDRHGYEVTERTASR